MVERSAQRKKKYFLILTSYDRIFFFLWSKDLYRINLRLDFNILWSKDMHREKKILERQMYE